MLDWPAARLRFRGLAARFDPAAKAHLLACGPQPVLVGCSGGADSVALLLAVVALLEESGTPVVAACFDHGQRPEATAEAAHVRALSAAIGVDFHRGESGLEPGLGEAELRAARYAWLGSLYHELRAGALCLGHHGDDVLETQLMAVLGGSGPAGLASPQPVKRFADGQVRVRPFVNLSRADLRQVLLEAAVPWCEDASNEDPHHVRNWMRAEWIPAAQAHLRRNLVGGARRTRQLMEEAAEALDVAVGRLGLDLSRAEELEGAVLWGQPAAVCRRALLAWWMRHHADRALGAEATDPLVAALARGHVETTVTIGRDAWLVLSAEGALRFRTGVPTRRRVWPAFCAWSAISGPLFLPDGALLHAERFSWKEGEAPYRDTDPRTHAWIAPHEGRFVVRLWEPGDRYQPLGAPGRRKLQDLFTDRSIAVEARHCLPVITDPGGDIIWVPGLPPAQQRALTPACNSALRLTYHSPCPLF